MLKFKALFKRGPKAPRKEVESHFNTSAAVGSTTPFSISNPSTSISTSATASTCSSRRSRSSVGVENGANEFTDFKLNESIMEEGSWKLKKDLQRYEILLADLSAENDQLKKMVARHPSMEEISSDSAGGGSYQQTFSNKEDIDSPSQNVDEQKDKDEVQSVSPEVSQLQNHLRQIQESHYCTNEELQATIQELTDLQVQLDQTRNEKEKFREEKTLLLESLYRQTERLQTAKEENENLQKLLHDSGSERSVPEREKKLIELLTQGQENREEMIRQINDLQHKLNEVQRAKELTEEANKCLAERVKELEITVEDVQYEKRVIEEELTAIKEEQNSKHFEILRLNVLLDIEESKVKELKAAQASLGNENELYAMMKNVLNENELLEKKMAESEDLLKRTISENEKLTEEMHNLRLRLIKLSEGAAFTMAEIETQSKLRKIEQKEASKKIEELDDTLRNMALRYGNLSQELKQAKKSLKITEDKLERTIIQMEEYKTENLKEKQKRDHESAEWKQLHDDLLVAVRVANDIKTDAQLQLERTMTRVRELEEANAVLIKRTSSNKEKSTQPIEEVFKTPSMLKAPSSARTPSVTKAPTVTKAPICSTTAASPRTLTVPVNKMSSRPSLQAVNVKSLIESIENASKQSKSGGQLESCSGSKAGSPQRETNPPLPFREQPLTTNRQLQQSTVPVISELVSPSDEKKDPLLSLVEKNGGSKRNALLKWVQNKTQGYPNIEITNFSSSWTDGLALCALLHTYLPHKIPYHNLTAHNKQYNFNLAFSAAEAEGIPTILNMTDMTQQERPDWQKVMSYVKEIYTHFEGHDAV